MINGQQMLVALAYCALSSEEIFGRGFVSYATVRSNIAQGIDALSQAVFGAANEPAAFLGIGFASVRDDFVSLILCDR